jgi:hypothetical protein
MTSSMISWVDSLPVVFWLLKPSGEYRGGERVDVTLRTTSLRIAARPSG